MSHNKPHGYNKLWIDAGPPSRLRLARCRVCGWKRPSSMARIDSVNFKERPDDEYDAFTCHRCSNEPE